MKKGNTTQKNLNADYESRMRDVRKKMKYGDQQSAAELTGLSSDYVKKVCGGTRVSKKILEAIESIVEHRESFKKQRQHKK